MDELEIQRELKAIQGVLEELIGRPSGWNGEVEISDNSLALGNLRWSGRISLSRDIIQSDARWRTQIHDLLHTFSVGLTPSAYAELRGWEEGVVEQLQRNFRPVVLARLSLPIPEHFFKSLEVNHRYNRYIEVLNTMCALLGLSASEFFLSLLDAPLADRPNYVLESRHSLPKERQQEFRRFFASSFSVMRGDRFHV